MKKDPPSGGFFSVDTITALATPKGTGALAIVRLSGPQALDIAAGMVQDPAKLRDADPRRLQNVEVIDKENNLIDRCLCALYHHPHSYTGEDSAEFFVHGSPYLATKVLERCRELGARLAGPGEFTQRAFLNGKLDLAQAEAVADLIAATGQAAHRSALAQMDGTLSRKLHVLRDRLIQLCALVELDLDFSDQEVPVVDSGRLKDDLAGLRGDLQSLAESYRRGRLAREGAVVVIAGSPNVGKSTLFNVLLGEDKAIMDAQPGTTRDSVEALIEWGGLTIRLVDTAGQAEHFQGPDRQAVERARQAARSADLALWVVDLSSPEAPELPPAEIQTRVILIGNKADLAVDSVNRYAGCLRVSALKAEGLEAIRTAVLTRLLPDGGSDLAEGILTRERHLEAVNRAITCLETGCRSLEQGRGLELLAEDLREAGAALGEILGEVVPDDVLNRIFATFCIGK